eukprot:GFYU01000849.1.p1 GENE.GFYU01000849.1~~GFYU01000849.1.p1  ORF type:complete len:365 (-),score=126.51 GFYU01000849.1:213-1307(-)
MPATALFKGALFDDASPVKLVKKMKSKLVRQVSSTSASSSEYTPGSASSTPQSTPPASPTTGSHSAPFSPLSLAEVRSQHATVKPVMTKVAKASEFDKRYIREQALGSGKFATVYRVFDKTTGENMCAKVVDKTKLSPAAADALKKEIDILPRLQHASCMQVTRMYEDDTRCIFVTPYLAGGDLLEHILENGALKEADAKVMAKSILQAIAHTHDAGIIHRDIKPENIVLNTADGFEATLVDYGLAHRLETDAKPKQICGTFEYLPPEMLHIAKGIGSRECYGKEVDLWSFGVVLYIALCGVPPFYGSNEDICDTILDGDYEFCSKFGWDNVSDDALDLVSSLLVVNPARRMSPRAALQHPWFQ